MFFDIFFLYIGFILTKPSIMAYNDTKEVTTL